MRKFIIPILLMVSLLVLVLSQEVDWSNMSVNYPTALDDSSSIVYADSGDTIESDHINKILRAIYLQQSKLGLGSSLPDGAVEFLVVNAGGDSTVWRAHVAADHSDEDWGDFSVSSGSFTLDDDVIAAAEMADANHGDFTWASGVATLNAYTVSNIQMDNADHGDVSWSSFTASVEDADTAGARLAAAFADRYTEAELNAAFQPLDADLTTLAGPTNWRVFYSNGSGVITEVALGASGTVLKSNGASAAPSFQTDATGAGGSAYADSIAHDGRNVIGDSLITDDEGDARFEAIDAAIAKTDETETITENWVNTANPWADNEVADNITASNYLLLTASNDTLDWQFMNVPTGSPGSGDSIMYVDAGVRYMGDIGDLPAGSGVNETHGSGWNADTDPPENDDIYDYLHQIDTDDDGDIGDEDISITGTWTLSTGGSIVFGDIIGADTLDASVGVFDTLDIADRWTIGGVAVTASAAEINTPLDGASVTLTEFQELEAIGSTTISAAQWTGLGGATTAGIALWDDADAAAQRTTLGLVIGTDVQADLGDTHDTSAELDALYEAELDNSAGLLAALSDETGTGVAVFATAPTFSTSINIPNGTNPTTDAAGEISIDTDDHFIEFYSDASRVVPSIQIANYVVAFPDSITDDVTLAHFPAEIYPHGIQIVYTAISASANCSDTHVLEEWDDAVGSSQSTVQSLALSTASKVEDATPTDGDMAVDSYLNINLDDATDDLNQIMVTIGYTVDPGD